ncbi:ATP-binding protein [Candidatus Nitrospira allomarina]|uniref:histidine kinase n=1 Tax=Candidatus Nitrospira allomarina TaxID=3020900 RepID=A0AA96GCZ6_9BACT|nr:ATP-binding protein [Candidatus Nitrospira allomarina]WNM56494.1 ATP-binding protein [Candidatus Nitrospira allomarina]
MNFNSLSLLIVDDCSEDREYLSRLLSHHPQTAFHIMEADSGIEGLQLCTHHTFHCILVDYQLPDVDGLEFLESFAESHDPRFLPVLMLTGQGNEEIASDALKNGASDYLVKNKITPEGLYRAVTRATEKSSLLRTNEKQRVEIERSQRDLEQFAYTAAHDLQAPVRRIIKFLELFQRELSDPLPARPKDYLSRAMKSAIYMKQLIQDLLNYSLVGGARNSFTSVDLNKVIKEVLSQLEINILKIGASIEQHPLPTVVGHKCFLQELFQNLIGNALKFYSDRPLMIRVSAEAKESEWIFTFKDNGIGIPPEGIEKIFNLFQRIETGTPAEGTGIGLALCKKIVEIHGGSIWVESTLNQGTAFHFSIPFPTNKSSIGSPTGTDVTEDPQPTHP